MQGDYVIDYLLLLLFLHLTLIIRYGNQNVRYIICKFQACKINYVSVFEYDFVSESRLIGHIYRIMAIII